MLKSRRFFCFSLSIVWFIAQNTKVVIVDIDHDRSENWSVPLTNVNDVVLASTTSLHNHATILNNHSQDESNGNIISNVLYQRNDDKIYIKKWGIRSNEEQRWARLAHLSNVTILKSMDSKWITASNYKRIVNETILGNDHLVRIEASNQGRIRSVQSVNQKLQKKFNAKIDFSSLAPLNRIYYINMDHRRLKRAVMEAWLSKQSVPFTRVSGRQGQEDSCVELKQGPRCVGISGLAQTNVHIMDTLDTNGFTLVLEDDFVIRDMKKLLASVHLVPPDWDVLRWDCWDEPLPHFPRYPFAYKLAPLNEDVCQNVTECWHCGGTHAVLWRGGESLEKLRRLWGTPPHDGIDCLLTDPSINTYCIQIGVGDFHAPMTELSDIPKMGNARNTK